MEENVSVSIWNIKLLKLQVGEIVSFLQIKADETRSEWKNKLIKLQVDEKKYSWKGKHMKWQFAETSSIWSSNQQVLKLQSEDMASS